MWSCRCKFSARSLNRLRPLSVRLCSRVASQLAYFGNLDLIPQSPADNEIFRPQVWLSPEVREQRTMSHCPACSGIESY